MAARVDHGFRLVTGRPPTVKERTRALKYLETHSEDSRALKEFSLALLNLNAFLYVN